MNTAEKIILACQRHIPRDSETLNAVKRQILRTIKSAASPTTADLLTAYHKLVKKNKIKPNKQLEAVLCKRAIRTLSGVTVVTVLTKPFPCPGKCIYCPNEARMPKSYLADEPAAARALALKFDPFLQVKTRLETLAANGHPTDKVELIVKGGSWNAYPPDYQYWFILRCFEAANRGSKPIKQSKLIKQNKLTKPFKIIVDNLLKAQKKNETAKHRIIGLTLETRPDFINEKNLRIMRALGCTRVELGAQHTDDKILELIKRGHKIAETIKATTLLKRYGFKVDYHLMPQLPGSTPKKDLAMLNKIFADENFRPDMIKIYPCTVVKNSELSHWVKNAKFKPYSDDQLIKILKIIKAKLPYYVRISRLIRDIPGHHIIAGNTITNLRQNIQAQMRAEGVKCRCLRCREVGHQNIIIAKKIKLFIEKYRANGGTEYFLSFEDKNRQAVYAFCRLRLDEHGLYPAFVRELHTYGQSLELKQKKDKKIKHIQHTGLGKKLILAAENICTKNKITILAVIAGIGVRGYYKNLGFGLKDSYMVKYL